MLLSPNSWKVHIQILAHNIFYSKNICFLRNFLPFCSKIKWDNSCIACAASSARLFFLQHKFSFAQENGSFFVVNFVALFVQLLLLNVFSIFSTGNKKCTSLVRINLFFFILYCLPF